MATSQPPAAAQPPPVFYSISINQTKDRATCATKDGYTVFRSPTLDVETTERRVLTSDPGPGGVVRLACRLDSSNIFAVVGTRRSGKFTENCMVMWDDRMSRSPCTVEYAAPIVGLRMAHNRILIATKNCVGMHRIEQQHLSSEMRKNTWDNPYGACDLVYVSNGSGDDDERRSVAAFPSPTRGEVIICSRPDRPEQQDVARGGKSSSSSSSSSSKAPPRSVKQTYDIRVPAHKSDIRVIALSPRGNLVATCSKKGTVVRLFETLEGKCIRQFRVTFDAQNTHIYDMQFSVDGTFLVVSTSHAGGSVHVFATPTEPKSTMLGWATSFVTDYFNEDGAVESVYLETCKVGPFVCWLDSDNQAMNVVSFSGKSMKVYPKTPLATTVASQKAPGGTSAVSPPATPKPAESKAVPVPPPRGN